MTSHHFSKSGLKGKRQEHGENQNSKRAKDDRGGLEELIRRGVYAEWGLILFLSERCTAVEMECLCLDVDKSKKQETACCLQQIWGRQKKLQQ